MESTHSRMDGENRVEIVAFPLYPVPIEVTAWLHSDEPRFQKDTDTFQRSILRHACRGSNSVVTGMASVRFAIFDQQQISVDHERRRRELQQKDFVGQ